MDYSSIKHFTDTFSRSQVQSILIAWLPTKLSPYLTGIMAVDMFVTTVIASGLSTLAYLIYLLISTILFGNLIKNDSITLQIDYYILGTYNERKKNVIYESLSWIISEQTKKLKKGSFILNLLPNLNNKDQNAIPNSNVLPINNQEISVKFEGKRFNIKYKNFDDNNNNCNNQKYYNMRYPYSSIMTNVDEKPSIYITSNEKSETVVDDISTLLNNITKNYLNFQKKNNGLFRYENNQARWQKIQRISSCRGLNSVALDEKQETLLKKELDAFVNNKKFYERIGMPYRRGILLYGKPGTGKTSLINAISSHLSRDIYHLNLKMIKDDNELSTVFSTVPSYQLIVLEDVDSQSNVLHKRDKRDEANDIGTREKNSNEETSNDRQFDNFSLSTFLACLDGHKLSEGNIIIMTTNHVDLLDTACIRPGRMDVHLELGYCTHYQLNRLFKIIINDAGLTENILHSITENLLPPCEVTTLMSLYHMDKDEIVIKKLTELVKKYETGNNTNTNNVISHKKRKFKDE